MHNRFFAVLIAVVAALVLASCSAPTATEVPFADVCKPENADQRVATVGYFAAGLSVYCSDTDGDYRCGMDFLDAPGSENRFTADVIEGNGRNQMAAIPDDYTDADLQFKTDDGTVIGTTQKARISGEMLISENVCLMAVDKIEAVSE